MFFSELGATVPPGEVGGFATAMPFIALGGMLVLMYFLTIRPNRKKEKQAAELRNSIEVGDEVTTIGGILGRVVSIKEDTFVLEISNERTRIRFKRWAIQDVSKLALDEAAEPESRMEKAQKAQNARQAAKNKKEKAAKE